MSKVISTVRRYAPRLTYGLRKDVGKVAKAVKKYVKRTLDSNTEDKIFDVNTSIAEGQASTNSSGSITNLSEVALGTDEGGRLGTNIKCKHLQFNMQAESFQSVTNGDLYNTHLRAIILIDKQNTGTAPSVANVLLSAGATQYNSMINRQFFKGKRYKVLLDKIFDLSPNLVGTTNVQFLYTPKTGQIIRKRIKLKGHKINYLPASTGIQGMIYLLLLSDQATAKAPSFQMMSRLTYEDA